MNNGASSFHQVRDRLSFQEEYMKTPTFFVGIDMSATTFTASVGTAPWQLVVDASDFDNHPDGFALFLAWLSEHDFLPDATILCMEATGVYGEALTYFITAHQYRIAVEPPLKVKRAFMPHGHKNDRVDSQQIAEYAVRFFDELRFWQPRDEILEKIKVILSTREQFTVQMTMHKNALHALERKVLLIPFALELHRKSIQQIKSKIKQIDAEIRRLIDQDPKYGQMIRLLLSVPGVGFLLASHMLLIMENAPNQVINPKQIAAFIGISPYEHRSGTSVYKPSSSRHYGPSSARKLLYLASLSMRTHNPTFKKYFLRKVAEGKPNKVVLNNIANKLVKLMCAVIASHKPFISNYRSIHPSLLQSP